MVGWFGGVRGEGRSQRGAAYRNVPVLISRWMIAGMDGACGGVFNGVKAGNVVGSLPGTGVGSVVGVVAGAVGGVFVAFMTFWNAFTSKLPLLISGNGLKCGITCIR